MLTLSIQERRKTVITLTRSLARHIRAVVRKAAPGRQSRSEAPRFLFQAGSDGLRIWSHRPDVTVAYHHKGQCDLETLLLPGEALVDFEGKNDTEVTMQSLGNGSVQARWLNGGVPQVKDYASTNNAAWPDMPLLPTKRTSMPEGFLKALADAASVAANNGTK